jgi:hypothetical protein
VRGVQGGVNGHRPRPVGLKPDFAKPTSRPTLRPDTIQNRAAQKRSGGGSQRAQDDAISCRPSAPDLSRAVRPTASKVGLRLNARNRMRSNKNGHAERLKTGAIFMQQKSKSWARRVFRPTGEPLRAPLRKNHNPFYTPALLGKVPALHTDDS